MASGHRFSGADGMERIKDMGLYLLLKNLDLYQGASSDAPQTAVIKKRLQPLLQSGQSFSANCEAAGLVCCFDAPEGALSCEPFTL